MTAKYVDGAGLRYFRDTYCLTTAQVNTLIQTAFAQYKQDVFTVVSALPQTGQQEGIMYLVPSSNDPTKLDGYIWKIVDDTTTPPTYGWKQPVQGQAQIDLSNYYTKAETDTLLLGKSNVGHTHSASEITDLQERWDYDSDSNAILVRGGSDVWTYDQQNDSVIVS